MRKPFQWNIKTKYEDMPKWLRLLIPSSTYVDDLDDENQFSHIRYRVQHEIDMHDEGEALMTKIQYRKAHTFMQLTREEVGEEVS